MSSSAHIFSKLYKIVDHVMYVLSVLFFFLLKTLRIRLASLLLYVPTYINNPERHIIIPLKFPTYLVCFSDLLWGVFCLL